MSATDTTVATDVWSTIDPEWTDLTIGPFRCPSCGGTVGMLLHPGDQVACDGCGRTFELAVRVWMMEPASTRTEGSGEPDSRADGGGGVDAIAPECAGRGHPARQLRRHCA